LSLYPQTVEEKEDEEDVWQDSSSEIPPAGRYIEETEMFFSPVATYSARKKTAVVKTATPTKQDRPIAQPLTVGKRLRSPGGESPDTDCASKQVRLAERDPDPDSAQGT
jgi:hypothetical protein